MKQPMIIDWDKTPYWRHQQKPVLADRLLDDMRDPGAWTLEGHVAPDNIAQFASWKHPCGTMSFAERDGRPVIRMDSPTAIDVPNPDKGRGWGVTTLYRVVDHENWQDYNRIIFDVYPDFPGFRVVSICMYLYNEGEMKLPNDELREGMHFVILRNQEWNRVDWEFPELGREDVVGFGLQYRLQGSEPGASDTIQLDFANLRLQRVDCDHARGWLPDPGVITFSHTGYRTDSAKTAISHGLVSDTFDLVRNEDHQVVWQGPVTTQQAHTGTYQVLDFSDWTQPGQYFLRAGAVTSQPFRIADDVWHHTIAKAVNFFTMQRCGDAVPGVHDVCHADFTGRYKDMVKVINGGWHDAGDLSQNAGNTADAAYGMLATALAAQDQDPELVELLLEEARWGMEYVLKTRFADGYRMGFVALDFWSDGVLGTFDDISNDARRAPGMNFTGAWAEAMAARAYQPLESGFAYRCRRAAVEDFNWALEDYEAIAEQDRPVELIGIAVLAAVELYRATGDETYSNFAITQAGRILACQQTEQPDWTIPVRGFFYTNATKDTILHYPHLSQEHRPISALRAVLSIAGDNDQAKAWIQAMQLFAEYIKTTVRYSQPYGMIPAGIYSLDPAEIKRYGAPPFGCEVDEAQAQMQQGVKLSDQYYLRLFPVWHTFRGNSGILLSAARAVLDCAIVLNDPELMEIVNRQMEWHLGRNPFNQSLMWGEGYNNSPQYTAMCGDMVGSLPVGVQAQGNEDVPYYPHTNCYNFKEVWVHTTGRWIWLMADLL